MNGISIYKMSENIPTAPEDFDHTEYANFAVEMVKIGYIALEMNHLNHYRDCYWLAVVAVAMRLVTDSIPQY